jgi:hypothetical protein
MNRKKDAVPTDEEAFQALQQGDAELLSQALFAFEIDDGGYIEKATQAVRSLLARPDLTSAQSESIGRAMYGLERLPLRTPGLDLEISLVIKDEDSAVEYSLCISEDRFSTTSGGYANFGSGGGSDSFSGSTFTVEPGWRGFDGWHLTASDWPDQFMKMRGARLNIQDCSELDIPTGAQIDLWPFWEWILHHA